MTLKRSVRRFGWRGFGQVTLCAILFAAGCHRTPETAAELAKALPRAFAGELHLQGDTQARRSARVLEFNRVDYQLQDEQGAPTSSGQARIRGTITLPGLDIRLEALGPDFSGGEDAIRPETFSGKLSGNLQSFDAEWSTGLGQKATLTMQAAPP
jgi:hypothetical protein